MRVKGGLVVALPLAALITIAAISLALLADERADRNAASRADQLVLATRSAQMTALTAATSVRAYADSLDPSFLVSYRQSLSRLAAVKADVLSAAAAGQAAAATALIGELDRQTALLARIAAVAPAHPDAGLLGAQAVGMAALDARVATINQTMTALVTRRRARVSTIEHEVVTVEIIGLVVGIAAGLAGMWMLTSGVVRRLRAAVANARRLGDGQPLAPTAPARDELGQLAVALHQTEILLVAKSDELTAARDEALTATQAKNRFLSRISHELRTPLNAILGFAQLLELSDLDERGQQDVAHIITAGRYLVGLIDEVLDIARIEAGEMTVSLEPVAVAGAVNDVIDLMRPLAADRSITIDLRRPSEELACQADKLRLNQVLLNLVSNAIKYNREAGRIDVTCTRLDPHFVGISVRDTGPGLTPAQLERLFVPFDRLGAESGSIEGTGIGLTLAKSLSEAMGGELDVTTSAGRGSTFTLRLPQAGPTAVGATTVGSGRTPTVADDPRVRPGPVRRVVYIEDNVANVKVVQRLFDDRPDVILDVAGSGQLGIDLARQHRPALILLDLHLPDLSGEVVLQRLRAEPATANIPVYVLSADAHPGTVRRLVVSGAAGYLPKPLNLRDVRRLVDRLTGPAPDPACSA